jgi:hypothetical protein
MLYSVVNVTVSPTPRRGVWGRVGYAQIGVARLIQGLTTRFAVVSDTKIKENRNRVSFNSFFSVLPLTFQGVFQVLGVCVGVCFNLGCHIVAWLWGIWIAPRVERQGCFFVRSARFFRMACRVKGSQISWSEGTGLESFHESDRSGAADLDA